jgi:hypothetical protein
MILDVIGPDVVAEFLEEVSGLINEAYGVKVGRRIDLRMVRLFSTPENERRIMKIALEKDVLWIAFIRDTEIGVVEVEYMWQL